MRRQQARAGRRAARSAVACDSRSRAATASAAGASTLRGLVTVERPSGPLQPVARASRADVDAARAPARRRVAIGVARAAEHAVEIAQAESCDRSAAARRPPRPRARARRRLRRPAVRSAIAAASPAGRPRRRRRGSRLVRGPRRPAGGRVRERARYLGQAVEALAAPEARRRVRRRSASSVRGGIGVRIASEDLAARRPARSGRRCGRSPGWRRSAPRSAIGRGSACRCAFGMRIVRAIGRAVRARGRRRAGPRPRAPRSPSTP